jgi:hypothetical protein
MDDALLEGRDPFAAWRVNVACRFLPLHLIALNTSAREKARAIRPRRPDTLA